MSRWVLKNTIRLESTVYVFRSIGQAGKMEFDEIGQRASREQKKITKLQKNYSD